MTNPPGCPPPPSSRSPLWMRERSHTRRLASHRERGGIDKPAWLPPPHLTHANARTHTHARRMRTRGMRVTSRACCACVCARAQGAKFASSTLAHVDVDFGMWTTLTGRPAGPDRPGGASPPGTARPPSTEVRVACPQRRPPRSARSLVTHGGLWLTRVTGLRVGGRSHAGDGLRTNPVTPTPQSPAERRDVAVPMEPECLAREGLGGRAASSPSPHSLPSSASRSRGAYGATRHGRLPPPGRARPCKQPAHHTPFSIARGSEPCRRRPPH